MTESEENVKSIRLSMSCEILGAIVKACGLRSDILDSRTTRRFFEGGNLSEARRKEIYIDFARILVHSGVIPDIEISDKGMHPFYSVVGFSLFSLAQQWDHVAGNMRSMPLREAQTDLAAMPYLRLAVVDLSLRLVGLLRLGGLPIVESEVPLWAREKSHGLLLRRLQHESDLTRENIVSELGVSDNSVDSWLDSKSYPTDANVVSLAHALSNHNPHLAEHDILAQLRRHYMLSRIGDLLADHIGRQNVAELITHLLTYIKRTLDGLRDFSHLPEDQAMGANFALLMFGSRFISAEHLIRALWRQEKDAVWRADLLAMPKRWHDRLTMTSQYLSSYPDLVKWAVKHLPVTEEEAGTLAKETLHSLQGDLKANPPGTVQEGFAYTIKGDAKFSAANRMIQARQAETEGDNETAIKHLRRAIELQPMNELYHFHLGALLGKISKVEEGVQECRKAVQLKPDWDLPMIEIGIIMVNNKLFDEGRRQLEETAQKTNVMTSHLAFSLAYARMSCKEFKGALELFDVVLKEKPEHARALDCAAYCCFMVGETDRGIALAKEASKHGAMDTYTEWRQGKYKKP